MLKKFAISDFDFPGFLEYVAMSGKLNELNSVDRPLRKPGFILLSFTKSETFFEQSYEMTFLIG